MRLDRSVKFLTVFLGHRMVRESGCNYCWVSLKEIEAIRGQIGLPARRKLHRRQTAFRLRCWTQKLSEPAAPASW